MLVVMAAGLAFWVTRPRQAASLPLPNEWAVAPRAIFTVDERRVYRQLRDAFPQHIVLAKLPLIRLCQPVDIKEMRYWFELLGGIHVSYAVCSPQGRVLLTIDLDGERSASRRTLQIKQGVLSACRIRNLRCTIEHLPGIAELQRLLQPAGTPVANAEPPAQAVPPPVHAHAPASPVAAPALAQMPLPAASRPATPTAAAVTTPSFFNEPAPLPLTPAAPETAAALNNPTSSPAWSRSSEAPHRRPDLATAEQPPRFTADVNAADAKRRKERKPLWQDSGLFQDSFFGIDNLRDAAPPSSFGSLLTDAARGRNATSVPPISADPSQGVLESERAKLQKQQGKL